MPLILVIVAAAGLGGGWWLGMDMAGGFKWLAILSLLAIAAYFIIMTRGK